ncbi:MAG: CorA family divalent cation transporter [Hyphomicrobium sp.]|jgi:hypothetical protein
MDQDKRVQHLRQILLWPVYLLPFSDDVPAHEHWDLITESCANGPWREIDDEFGDPAEFQARHYNEFVTFLPPVQRFLYGQGIGKSVRKVYGESPIRVLRRNDVAQVRVTLDKDGPAVTLEVKHVDLYFFFDVDIVMLNLEVFADDLPLSLAQDLMFRFGRAYPAYWEENGRGGHCPWRVEWLSAAGEILAASDYENREKYLSFVCRHRAAATASHWEFLMDPLVGYHCDKKGELRYRQLEYYRMPYMTFLAMEDIGLVTRADCIRLALGSQPGSADTLPHSETYLGDFERRYCYDRHFSPAGESSPSQTRFLASGHTLVVLGDGRDEFFMNGEGGMLGRFRHQHFLMFLIAHFQKASLRMFSDRLVAAVSRLEIASAKANRAFRAEIRAALENFLRFAQRYWFHEISNQAQTRELFVRTRDHLELDGLYAEVREELQDMASFLEVEATRRQNETVVRLTVVTTFGLVGTVTTGFLGMNLIAWAEEPAWWRVAAFMVIFVPTTLLTLYTVMKSPRLSEFLDSLSDEEAGWVGKWHALTRVWSKKG